MPSKHIYRESCWGVLHIGGLKDPRGTPRPQPGAEVKDFFPIEGDRAPEQHYKGKLSWDFVYAGPR